jgi:hypothetical protein
VVAISGRLPPKADITLSPLSLRESGEGKSKIDIKSMVINKRCRLVGSPKQERPHAMPKIDQKTAEISRQTFLSAAQFFPPVPFFKILGRENLGTPKK